MSDFLILQEGGQGEIVEKKSRFIATLSPVNTKEEAQEFISAMKKKYYDARHNCYAYVLGAESEEFKSSDDGEPSGTAGRPILEVLNGAGVHNAVCVVTRYFGGILLGTGGLVRAYTDATKEGIAACVLAKKRQGTRYLVTVSYTDLGKLQNYHRNHDVCVEEENFGENVEVLLCVPAEETEQYVKDITQLFAGKVIPEEMEKTEYFDKEVTEKLS